MWFVYIVRCADGTYYTGITQNIKRRIDEHNKSDTVSAKYTRQRRPVKLVYQELLESRSKALKRETEIKRLRRQAKEVLMKPIRARSSTVEQ